MFLFAKLLSVLHVFFLSHNICHKLYKTCDVCDNRNYVAQNVLLQISPIAFISVKSPYFSYGDDKPHTNQVSVSHKKIVTTTNNTKLGCAGEIHRNSNVNSLIIRRNESKNMRENVSRDVAEALYEDMLLGRYVEDMCAQQYYRGKIAGFVHLYSGQEAVSTGIIKALNDDDFVISSYRDHVHAISKGVPTEEVFAELLGKESGCSKGRGGSMHMFSKKFGFVGGFAFIGEQIPIALGVAFSIVYKNEKSPHNKLNQVAVCFMGDGTTNIGQFYESLNMARLAKLPVIFVVENNNWAIGMASHRSTSNPGICDRAAAFGIEAIEVDGMDVLAVRKAARDAINRARNGGGPSVIEAITYRFRGHSLADPDEMRAREEKKFWNIHDPIRIFEDYMKSINYSTDYSLKYSQQKIRQVVKDAMKIAEAGEEPRIEDLSKYVYDEVYRQPVEKEELLTAEELKDYAASLIVELERTVESKNKSTPLAIQLNKHPMRLID